jgi:hypothetical protein
MAGSSPINMGSGMATAYRNPSGGYSMSPGSWGGGSGGGAGGIPIAYSGLASGYVDPSGHLTVNSEQWGAPRVSGGQQSGGWGTGSTPQYMRGPGGQNFLMQSAQGASGSPGGYGVGSAQPFGQGVSQHWNSIGNTLSNRNFGSTPPPSAGGGMQSGGGQTGSSSSNAGGAPWSLPTQAYQQGTMGPNGYTGFMNGQHLYNGSQIGGSSGMGGRIPPPGGAPQGMGSRATQPMSGFQPNPLPSPAVQSQTASPGSYTPQAIGSWGDQARAAQSLGGGGGLGWLNQSNWQNGGSPYRTQQANPSIFANARPGGNNDNGMDMYRKTGNAYWLGPQGAAQQLYNMGNRGNQSASQLGFTPFHSYSFGLQNNQFNPNMVGWGGSTVG